MNSLGKRILFLRKNKKLTQKQLAEATGIQRGNLSHYEKDKVKPTVGAIITLANFFNVSIDWLLTGVERLNEANLFHKLNDHEKSEVMQYIEYIMWKRNKTVHGTIYIAENMDDFNE